MSGVGSESRETGQPKCTCPWGDKSDGNPYNFHGEGCAIFASRGVEEVSPAPTKRRLIGAMRHLDWQQVVVNGGPPCFYLGPENDLFCLRARRWPGHPADHKFVSLVELFKKFAEGGEFAESEQNKAAAESSTVPGATAPPLRNEPSAIHNESLLGELKAALTELLKIVAKSPFTEHNAAIYEAERVLARVSEGSHPTK